MQIYKHWTPEEVTLLVNKYKAGWMAKDIANRLGRSKDSVTDKIRKLKLKKACVGKEIILDTETDPAHQHSELYLRQRGYYVYRVVGGFSVDGTF